MSLLRNACALLQLKDRAVGAFLMLLAWGLAAPISVEAGCAYYVVSKAHLSATGLVDLEQQLLAGTISASADAAPGEPSNRPAPCPGGLCSQSPRLPLAQAPPTTYFEQWGLHALAFLLADTRPVMVFSLDEIVRPENLGISIFHPPRLSRHFFIS